jgi:choline dehydrogenase
MRLGLVRPQSSGRIKITSADINAPLLIDPTYLSAGADLTALCAAVEHCRAIGLTAGLCEWRKQEIGEIPSGKAGVSEYVVRNIGSYWHSVGTCAIGVHEDAVVDPSLHVHGVENLRVADASIMPAITSGNTNAPTLMIAERAAQMLMGS